MGVLAFSIGYCSYYYCCFFYFYYYTYSHGAALTGLGVRTYAPVTSTAGGGGNGGGGTQGLLSPGAPGKKQNYYYFDAWLWFCSTHTPYTNMQTERERERERETDSERDRQTDRQKHNKLVCVYLNPVWSKYYTHTTHTATH
jgi:hypothetical protein